MCHYHMDGGGGGGLTVICILCVRMVLCPIQRTMNSTISSSSIIVSTMMAVHWRLSVRMRIRNFRTMRWPILNAALRYRCSCATLWPPSSSLCPASIRCSPVRCQSRPASCFGVRTSTHHKQSTYVQLSDQRLSIAIATYTACSSSSRPI